jgi:putative hydrolase of the HAD superfamily
MAIEAVVFDWGGTLSTWADVELVDLWRAAARRLAPEREDEVVRRLVAVEAASWRWTATTRRSTTLEDILATASRELGLDVEEAVRTEAAEHHLAAWTPHITHDPEAAPTLEALRRRGLRVGLLSNTHWPRAFHEDLLAKDGLDGLIDARVYTSELDWVKPHPAAFRAVLDELGVEAPPSAVFVGDRPYDDMRGARQSGMRAVWRANDHTPGGEHVSDAVIASLTEIPPLIDAWSAR